MRIVGTSGGQNLGYAYDYFIKDHLGNTRVVLTDEEKTDAYPVASLESGTINSEKLYYTIPDDAATRVNKNTVAGYPTDSYTNPNDFIQKLNGNGTKVGTSITLKVMSGDSYNIRANSWYRLNGASPATPISPISSIIANLVNGVSAASGGKATIAALQGGGVLDPAVTNFLGTQTVDPNKPKAYLNWILLDEQFKYAGGSFEQVGSNEEFKTFVKTSLPITKNGYLYVYISNETPNVDVFFDNLQVCHVRGPLLEETHYYPFGLTMAGISSKASGTLKNMYKFGGKELQSNEFSDNSGLELYDFSARNYDPQVGRFWGGDKKADKLVNWSPYTYCLNNPIKFFDPDGEFPIEIHVRSFAPFNWFGGGLWKGDGYNRGFSTQYAGHSSRIRQITSYETTTMASSSSAYGNWSESKYGARAFSGAKIEDDFSYGNRVYTHLAGNNDALVPSIDGGPTHDIDVWTDLHIGVAENKDGSSVLSLTGELAGDGFPSSEAFLVDGTGKNKVFLGVGAAKAGPNEGPFVTLAGDQKEKQFDINLRIAVDKKGNFTGVYSTDKSGKETIIPIADWNKQFEKQNPRRQWEK